jgi:hypothetical protein
MIELLPRENYAERQGMVEEAVRHAEAHRAPGGAGWTQIFVAPAAEVSIEIRAITLAALADILGPDWKRCSAVSTGYSSHRDDCLNAFAFRPAKLREDPWNVVYGTFNRDRVSSLCVTHCERPLMPALHRLGTTFQLMLCDLWQDLVIDLADPAALACYVDRDNE